MPSANELAVAYVRHVLEKTGLSPTALAESAGIASTTLTRPLNSADYKFALSNTTIRKIEAFSKITFADFSAGNVTSEDQPRRTKGQPVNYVPGEEVMIPGRAQLLPIYSGAQGGSGKLIVSPDVVDRIEMPTDLKDVRGAYGIMIDGESMIPEFWPGDIAFINPILRPARGQPHVFFHNPPLGEDAEAIIKRLNGWNDRDWDLQQWNPAKEFKESRKIWPICHRVVGKKYAT